MVARVDLLRGFRPVPWVRVRMVPTLTAGLKFEMPHNDFMWRPASLTWVDCRYLLRLTIGTVGKRRGEAGVPEQVPLRASPSPADLQLGETAGGQTSAYPAPVSPGLPA